MKQLKIIFSGGGTGGHIFPAIAIANAIRKMVPGAEILFVGALGRMEMEKVPAAGYRIIGIPIAGLQRKFTLANLKLPFLIVMSLFKTRKIINKFKPDVVVGTGGYASGPLLRAAQARKIPVLIQEQNSYAGITNRLLAKRAAKICVAYDGMERYFPGEKLLMTGNPVRQDLTDAHLKREEAIKFFKLDPERKTILVIGGSQGARTINQAIGAGLKKFALNKIQILWQTGKAYHEMAQQHARDMQSKDVFIFDFIQRMDLAYAVADIVISRAGASSVSELCNMALPSILVPSPNVAEDHQTRNAMALVSRGATILVKDEAAKRQLVDAALALSMDAEKKKQLSENIRKMAYYDSADRIAKEVLRLGGFEQK